MPYSPADRAALRELGKELADVAALPAHREKAALWTRMNDLEGVRPLVWLNEIPWHEMDVDGELTPRCEGKRARDLETGLRRTLYQWKHMAADMIVSDFIECPLRLRSTGFGIQEDAEILKTDARSGIVSRRFRRQIFEASDKRKIRKPEVSLDERGTEEEFQAMSETFAGVLPVRKMGIRRTWFAPWDLLIRFWGVEEAMMDLALRTEVVNEVMEHFVDCFLRELDQWEALNALALNSDNTRIGSGAYGYTTRLPAPGFDPARVRTKDMWGCATAQIFSEVSPEMHWEFALRHEMRWLERWGLTYYGCCEPLDRKVEMLRRIPNLRKISMSPKADAARGAEAIGRDYVFSFKPNPAILAEDRWRPEQARKELRETLAKARGCCVEIIMKDISTVRYEPRRLWEWTRIAMETAEEFA